MESSIESQKPDTHFTIIIDNGNKCNSVQFSTDFWTEALSEFMLAVKQAGFIVDRDSVAINRKKHCAGMPHDEFGYYTDFNTKEQ